MESDYRNFALRRHRVLGHYLVQYAWRHAADCLVLDRLLLAAYLGLEKFREERVQWLCDDLRPVFPYSQAYYFEAWLSTLVLSRVPLHTLPRPVRTEEDFLKANPGAAYLKSGPHAPPDVYASLVGDFLSFKGVSELDLIALSPRSRTVARPKAAFTEVTVLAILALGLAGLDDARGYCEEPANQQDSQAPLDAGSGAT